MNGSFLPTLGFIYIRAKATSLLTCCIVSNLCIYTTATAVTANIKEKNRFRVRFHSNINEPLGVFRVGLNSNIHVIKTLRIKQIFLIHENVFKL